MKITLNIFILVIILTYSNSLKGITINNTTIKTSNDGQISVKASNPVETDTTEYPEIVLKIISISELDTQNKPIKQSILDLNNNLYTFSSVKYGLYQGVNTMTISFLQGVNDFTKNNINYNFLLNVFVNVFLEEGKVNLGSEKGFKVTHGSFKIITSLNNWVFCDKQEICKTTRCCVEDEVYKEGKSLELKLKIISSNSQVNPLNFSQNTLSDNQSLGFRMYFSNEITSSNQSVDSSIDSPIISTSAENSEIYDIIFPRFENIIEYETIVMAKSSSFILKLSIILLSMILVIIF